MEAIELNDGMAKLQAAIAQAQADMHNPTFDSENPYFKSKFASLAAVRNAVIPQLAKRGVAVFQDLTAVEGGVACTTILAGFGAEIRFGPLAIPAAKKDAHGYAAAGSYAKRIHLQAVACVVGDDDDDGNTAVGNKPMKDNSGRPDTTHLDEEIVGQYAEMMREIIDSQDAKRAQRLHIELNSILDANGEKSLYVAAADKAGKKAKWRELVNRKEAEAE